MTKYLPLVISVAGKYVVAVEYECTAAGIEATVVKFATTFPITCSIPVESPVIVVVRKVTFTISKIILRGHSDWI